MEEPVSFMSKNDRHKKILRQNDTGVHLWAASETQKQLCAIPQARLFLAIRIPATLAPGTSRQAGPEAHERG